MTLLVVVILTITRSPGRSLACLRGRAGAGRGARDCLRGPAGRRAVGRATRPRARSTPRPTSSTGSSTEPLTAGTTRVLDPACGTGHFLVAAARRLGCPRGARLRPRPRGGPDRPAAAAGRGPVGPGRGDRGPGPGRRRADCLGRAEVRRGRSATRRSSASSRAVRPVSAADSAPTPTPARPSCTARSTSSQPEARSRWSSRSRSSGPATPVRCARRAAEVGAVTELWVSDRPVFRGTTVLACVPVVRIGASGGPGPGRLGPAGGAVLRDPGRRPADELGPGRRSGGLHRGLPGPVLRPGPARPRRWCGRAVDHQRTDRARCLRVGQEHDPLRAPAVRRSRGRRRRRPRGTARRLGRCPARAEGARRRAGPGDRGGGRRTRGVAPVGAGADRSSRTIPPTSGGSSPSCWRRRSSRTPPRATSAPASRPARSRSARSSWPRCRCRRTSRPGRRGRPGPPRPIAARCSMTSLPAATTCPAGRAHRRGDDRSLMASTAPIRRACGLRVPGGGCWARRRSRPTTPKRSGKSPAPLGGRRGTARAGRLRVRHPDVSPDSTTGRGDCDPGIEPERRSAGRTHRGQHAGQRCRHPRRLERGG